MNKRFSLEEGDNGFWIIKNKDKYFLSMRYKIEATVVVNYLNLNEGANEFLKQKLLGQTELINTLEFENYKLKQLLKKHDIEVED